MGVRNYSLNFSIMQDFFIGFITCATAVCLLMSILIVKRPKFEEHLKKYVDNLRKFDLEDDVIKEELEKVKSPKELKKLNKSLSRSLRKYKL